MSYKKKNNNIPAVKQQREDEKTKQSKPSPIQVNIGNEGYLALHVILNNNLGSGKFVTNHMKANQAARIQPTDIDSHNKITTILAERGYEFYTFKNKDERNKCFILRGMV